MGYSDEDTILIDNLYVFKGYGAKKDFIPYSQQATPPIYFSKFSCTCAAVMK